MSTLTQEVRNVQNPALGGVLLWRFVCGHVEKHKTNNPPIPLLFIVLPILFHCETFEVLKSTRTGLHGFANKFSSTKEKKSDVLLGIQTRADSWRELTWASVQLAIRSRLVTLSPSDGTVIPVTTTPASGVPQSIKPLVTNAEKIGAWCSELSLFEIGTTLKVGF